MFPINIAFWLFTRGHITPYPEEGAAESYIAPRARRDRTVVLAGVRFLPFSGGRYEPFIWLVFYFHLHVTSAVFADKVGKERSSSEAAPNAAGRKATQHGA